MSQVCKMIRVSGRVQGVFFRAFTHQVAQELQLQGWVQNEDDGSVLLLACGEKEKLDLLIKALHQGPAAARVDRVEVTDTLESAEIDFVIKR